MPNVMHDLETLGKRPGFSIMSIGAVEFGASGLGREFYTAINRQSCLEAGLKEDPETVAWWNDQSPEARGIFDELERPETPTLLVALLRFSTWLAEGSVYEPTKLWGNGAGFDQPILAAAYAAVGQRPVWEFYNERCFRTLKALGARELEPKRQGIYHNALDDAKHQARWAISLNEDLEGKVF